MTVVSKEVKTLIRIHIEKEEFCELVRFYLFNPEGFERDLYPKAFSNLRDDSDESISEFFDDWIISPNCDTYAFIAYALGFDGWENSGYIQNNTLRMCVYNYGDKM